MKGNYKMDELDEIKKLMENLSTREDKLKYLRSELGVLAKELKDEETKKFQIEADLKHLNKRIMDLHDRIRKIWSPFIAGAEKAELDCDGIILSTAPTLNISVETKDDAIGWLESHGYKDVMKWDINTNTLKAIAREKYEGDDPLKIPGLKYSTFQVVKIKH